MATKRYGKKSGRPQRRNTPGAPRYLFVLIGIALAAGFFLKGQADDLLGRLPFSKSAASAPQNGPGKTAKPSGGATGYRVTQVPDGDSIVVRPASGKDVRVRLYGVDAPELHQRGGKAAADFSRAALRSETVALQVMDVDQYGRSVALVILRDGSVLNEVLVAEGHAWVYRAHCHREPECSSWYARERQAKKEGLGLWRDANPTPPWQWRRENPRQR